MNKELKRHLISAGITFITGFALAVVPMLDSVAMQDVKNGALLGILFAGVRAGIKGVFELIANRK